MRRVRHSNSRKLNAVEAGRFSHKRNPLPVPSPESNERRNRSDLHHRRSVLRGQCNSNSGHNRSSDRNRSLKPNALRDPRSSKVRKANASAVRPSDRDHSRKRSQNNKVRRKNSRPRREVVHRLSVAVVVARGNRVSLNC